MGHSGRTLRYIACMDDWPKPPIWREDLDKIRELMTPEEYKALLKRLVHIEPDGPLVDTRQVFKKPIEN